MTVTAPPRPPRPTDPVDRDELEALVEALIEEARQRARRRRRIGHVLPRSPCQCNWRITGGTKAYAGLEGRGREGGLYSPGRVDVTMTGTVSR